MANHTKDNTEKIKETLQYIGLDLTDIPEVLLDYHQMEYRTVKGYQDKNSYKVYEYIDVRDIQILLTPANRLDSLKEKYDKALPLSSYLLSETEEQIYQHSMFLNMLYTVSPNQIKKIEEEQESFQSSIPFKVKYYENYLWQIYYSEVSDQYFMLVPTFDSEYACFFYLLKKQLECEKKQKGYSIFVPVCHKEYSGEFLRRTEIADIENYLWLFTKDWPLVYEVRDKQGNLSIQIVGETVIYEKMKSDYKIVLNSKQEASIFYSLLKALFILQTELPEQYSFSVKINEQGGLDFYQKEKKITYLALSSYLQQDYDTLSIQLKTLLKSNTELRDKVKKVKQAIQDKTQEYLQKEREISTYLECRKSFFGKVKYFIQNKKKKKQKLNVAKQLEEETEQENGVEEFVIETKPFYTIEDMVRISKQVEEKKTQQVGMTLDLKAAMEKEKKLDYKIANATSYLAEIDKHNKSIFDFWRYTNKDNDLALTAGEGEKEEENFIQLEKSFDYEEDLLSIGVKADRLQRERLTKEQWDAIFITTTNVFPLFNQINKEQLVEQQIEESLKEQKFEAQQDNQDFETENFDIFGGIAEDRTKVKTIAGKKHREVGKNKYKILDITKTTQKEQYKKRLQELNTLLAQATKQAKALTNMAIYIAEEEPNLLEGYQLFHINPMNAIPLTKEKIILYRFNIKETNPILYLTNCVFFDNYNKTLPLGMDITDEVLCDMNQYEKKQIKEEQFRYLRERDNKAHSIEIVLKEYDLIPK